MRAFGKYRLVEPIASGGMAEVWRAEAPGPEGFVKEVALKLIRGDHDARGDFVAMFIQEARLASRLAHGNIVQVFEFDQVRGRYYIAMELVRGRTLRQVVDRCREVGVRFGLARAVHVCAEMARALAYAHRLQDDGRPAGLVHRDVSPQNVLLSFEGEVKLTDFGIARALGSSEVTSPGTIKGKLAYMAPEQARGGAVDGRADIFAVGVILWELCTGRRLFARDSDAAMLAAVVAPDPISPPSLWNEAVPPELDAIVLGALAREPALRTASADDLASALGSMRLRLATAHEDLDLRALLARLWPEGGDRTRAASPERTLVRLASSIDDPPISGPARAEPPTRTALRAVAGPRWRVGAFAAVLALAAAAGGIAAYQRRAASGEHRAVAVPSPAPAANAPSPAAPAISRLEQLPPAGPVPASVVPDLPPPPPPPRPAVGSGTEGPGGMSSETRRPVRRAKRAVAPDGSPAPAGAVQPDPTVVALPAAAARPPEAEGTVAVRATPWALVTIDGEDAGETPLDRAVAARAHRIHARHPTLGDDEVVVNIAPGQRYVWKPTLSK